MHTSITSILFVLFVTTAKGLSTQITFTKPPSNFLENRLSTGDPALNQSTLLAQAHPTNHYFFEQKAHTFFINFKENLLPPEQKTALTRISYVNPYEDFLSSLPCFTDQPTNLLVISPHHRKSHNTGISASKAQLLLKNTPRSNYEQKIVVKDYDHEDPPLEKTVILSVSEIRKSLGLHFIPDPLSLMIITIVINALKRRDLPCQFFFSFKNTQPTAAWCEHCTNTHNSMVQLKNNKIS